MTPTPLVTLDVWSTLIVTAVALTLVASVVLVVADAVRRHRERRRWRQAQHRVLARIARPRAPRPGRRVA